MSKPFTNLLVLSHVPLKQVTRIRFQLLKISGEMLSDEEQFQVSLSSFPLQSSTFAFPCKSDKKDTPFDGSYKITGSYRKHSLNLMFFN